MGEKDESKSRPFWGSTHGERKEDAGENMFPNHTFFMSSQRTENDLSPARPSSPSQLTSSYRAEDPIRSDRKKQPVERRSSRRRRGDSREKDSDKYEVTKPRLTRSTGSKRKPTSDFRF